MDVFDAYQDDRHPSRGVAVLGLSVKVRLQFTCNLRHHVVLKERVFLKRDYNELKLYDLSCMWRNAAVRYRDPAVGEDILCRVSHLHIDLQHFSNQLLQEDEVR